MLLGQALHRFLAPSERDALVSWAAAADVLIAGTDYDDEQATGTLLHAFDARICVVADLTGAIRRKLGLPVRPLRVAAAASPPGTRKIGPGDTLRIA